MLASVSSSPPKQAAEGDYGAIDQTTYAQTVTLVESCAKKSRTPTLRPAGLPDTAAFFTTRCAIALDWPCHVIRRVTVLLRRFYPRRLLLVGPRRDLATGVNMVLKLFQQNKRSRRQWSEIPWVRAP
jgi:hypothetical protein